MGRSFSVTHLVLLNDLAECNNLCVGEAREGVDVIGAPHELAVVLGEAPLLLEELARRGVLRPLAQPAVDAALEVAEPPRDLVGLAADEEVDSLMLADELQVQPVLELAERYILVAGDGDGRGLVLGGVCLDLVLERVVVEVILGGLATEVR